MVWMPLIWVLAVSTRYVRHNKPGKPKKINYCCAVHTFNLYTHDAEIKTGETLQIETRSYGQRNWLALFVQYDLMQKKLHWPGENNELNSLNGFCFENEIRINWFHRLQPMNIHMLFVTEATIIANFCSCNHAIADRKHNAIRL